MKIPSSRRMSGFTLVELLVVIAIIAVLAGAGFAAGNAAIQKAKKATALSTVVGIEAAVNNFYTEYGSLPADPVPTAAVNTRAGASGIPLLQVLLGFETSTTPLNSRGIKFLSAKEGKANRNGLIYGATGTTVTGLFDPWGGGYLVIMDDNYDDIVIPTPSAGGSSISLNGRRCAAWSNGADAVSGTGGTITDDVKNW